MPWTWTAPTKEELARLPAIGSHWINLKTERWIEAGRKMSLNNLKSLEIIVTGTDVRDDEVADSLQIRYCLAIAPEESDLFMTDLYYFYENYRKKE